MRGKVTFSLMARMGTTASDSRYGKSAKAHRQQPGCHGAARFDIKRGIDNKTGSVPMSATVDPQVVQLGSYNVRRGESSVSGLSSGAFMTVQLHLAHSSSFVGAGVIAGGPFRCAQTYRAAALLAED
ncbi:MAG TPA: hypothetical protein VFP68_02185, partial [Burkholderiaceae bacterium]|nr:hypothetical protein [Burkholderiaceae bacterium]